MGKGTFVGPRAALPVGRSSEQGGKLDEDMLSLGVVIFRLGDHRGDWYSRLVLKGLDEEAAARLVRVELYGSQGGDVHTLSQRLMASRPEVLACVLTGIRDLAVVAEAQRLNIPVVGAGYRMHDFGVPSVCADDPGGAALAVRHLHEHGHRRIGYVQLAVNRTYAFRRRAGYLGGLQEAGLEHDEGLVHWLPTSDMTGTGSADESGMVETWAEQLRDYLRKRRPTGLVVGNGMIMEALAQLIQAGDLRVPEDLSIVTFDQTYEIYRGFLGTLRPTVIALPWEQFGRRLVSMACDVAGGEPVAQMPQMPCQLQPGDTVANVS